MDIVRFPDWEERLGVYLARVEEEPFVWGTHDCALFAASAVMAQTGVDVAAEYRGKYDTATGAKEALREFGAGTLLKTVISNFGQPISVHFAKRGDLIIRDVAEREGALGVCVGQYSYFIGEQEGRERLVAYPTALCRYAFTVPFEARPVSDG